MSSSGCSNTKLEILNRHRDDHRRKVDGGAATPVFVPVLRFEVVV